MFSWVCFSAHDPRRVERGIGRNYFIKLGQQQSYQRDCAQWSCMRVWCEIIAKHYFYYYYYYYYLQQQQVRMGVGPTLVYTTTTICSYNNCVYRYHELLFFNQIIMIIINRRKLKRAFHTIGCRFEYRMRIIYCSRGTYYIIILCRYLELISIVTMLVW